METYVFACCWIEATKTVTRYVNTSRYRLTKVQVPTMCSVTFLAIYFIPQEEVCYEGSLLSSDKEMN